MHGQIHIKSNCVFLSEMNRIIVVPQKIFLYDNIAVKLTTNVSLKVTLVSANLVNQRPS